MCVRNSTIRRNRRVGIVAPFQGFCRFAPSTTRGCELRPGYRIRPLQGRERRVSAASHPESAPVATGRRSGNRSVPASDRHLPSPEGARSYSPGRSAAQAWDPGPPPSICPEPQRGVTMCGRDNVRPEFDNPGATDALVLSRPFRAFVDSRLRQPGAARPAPRAIESGPYRAENFGGRRGGRRVGQGRLGGRGSTELAEVRPTF